MTYASRNTVPVIRIWQY